MQTQNHSVVLQPTDFDTNPNIYHVQPNNVVKRINFIKVAWSYFLLVPPLICALLTISLLITLCQNIGILVQMIHTAISMPPIVFSIGWEVTLVIILCGWMLTRISRPVYLLDFATFKAPESWKLTKAEIIELLKKQNFYTEESLEFTRKLLEKSGTSESTAWPPAIVQSIRGDKPIDESINAAREEAKAVIFPIVQELLDKLKMKPRDIDILIVNCSLFSPTPSLCAMIHNHFKMRSDAITYNLSGMGCSAGVIAIDLAAKLLKRGSAANALVISTENLTQNLYHGNDRSMLLQNTLFRCGASAVFLSNKYTDMFKAKLKLLHTVRTQTREDNSYQCVYECEDSESHHGVRLSKDIVTVAGKAMEQNLTTLGPLVLATSEQAKVLVSIVYQKIRKILQKYLENFGQSHLMESIPKIKTYVPNFTKTIHYFCVHAGGRAVLEGIEKNLNLQPHHISHSKDTLYKYGNTSSSSIWYEMESIFQSGKLQRGERILQLGFGSGFKCNSAVWVALQNIKN